MSPGARLALEGVEKRYAGADRAALAGVDLEAAAGEILVLLGTSGAGKTTLLRIVAGLEAADAGRVTVGGRVVSDPRVRVPPQRRGVGMVFQHLELWSHMTVAENIAFGLPKRPRGRAAEGHARVRALAERVGVGSLLTRRPGTLSGGERQRVAIARTLAPDPQVVLYDEPLANLDPERRTDLRRLIRNLCREGASALLYVTHDAEEAMELGDEIAVLHRGRVADRGPPARLYEEPASLTVARALGPVTALAGRAGNGTVATPLGVLPTRSPERKGSVLALLRPEQVTVDGGGEAVVVDSRPGAGHWGFTARLSGQAVEGRSPRRLTPGERVSLRVGGPVAVVGEEEKA